MNETRSRYLNPYVGGVLLGLILFATYYITGRGLGASGAIKSAVVTTVDGIAPEHAKKPTAYYGKFIEEGKNPMDNWLSYEVLGILAGAFLSGVLFRRINLTLEKSPKITSKTRIIIALIGGILFGAGSQFSRGCTSGAALSGMAVLSASGIITMMAIFGSAYLFSWIFKKYWI